MSPGPLVPVIYKFFMISQRMELCSIFVILFMTCAIVGQLYCFMSVFELKFFLKYSPFFFSCFYGLLCNMILQVLHRRLVNQNDLKSLLRIDVEVIRGQIKSKFDATIMKMKTVFVIQMVCSFATVLNLIHQWDRHKDDLMVLSFMLHQHVSRDSAISRLIHYVLYVIIMMAGIFPSIAVPACFIYIMFHIKIKMHLLIGDIHKLKNNLREIKKDRLGNNVNYHKYLMRELKVIVKQHLEIIRYNREIMEVDQLLYMIYVCSAILLGTATILQFFSLSMNFSQSLGTICNFTVFAYTACDCAQDYTNASMELSEALYELEWYNWNVECQKSFLILFAYSTKGIKVTIFSMFDVGKELLKRVYRILYTVASLSYSIRDLI